MGQSIWRPEFDPTAELVVSHKGLLFGGRRFEPGEKFNEQTTTRAKRNLYDMRHLNMVPREHTPAASAPRPAAEAEEAALLASLAPPGWKQPVVPEREELTEEDAALLSLIAPGFDDETIVVTEAAVASLNGGVLHIPLEVAQQPAITDATSAQQPATQNAPRQLRVIPMGHGWYNVVDEADAVVNQKRLHLKEAEALAAKG